MDDLNVQQNNRFITLPKFIFAVLGLILFVELIYAVRVLTLPAPSFAGSMPMPLKVGTISLNTPKVIYKVNEVIPVAVNIDTVSQVVDGVDVIIHYDPKILEATSGGLLKGHLLEEYPTMAVDANKGLISMSGISALQNGFKGIGQFATINFKAKAIGKASLVIDFQGKGSTTDSNLVDVGTSSDMLERVVNLELLVQ